MSYDPVTETGPDGTPIGVLAYIPRNWLDPVGPQLLIYVEPEYRRQGVATRLLAKGTEAWGIDVLAIVKELADAEPGSFSEDGMALAASVLGCT